MSIPLAWPPQLQCERRAIIAFLALLFNQPFLRKDLDFKGPVHVGYTSGGISEPLSTPRRMPIRGEVLRFDPPCPPLWQAAAENSTPSMRVNFSNLPWGVWRIRGKRKTIQKKRILIHPHLRHDGNPPPPALTAPPRASRPSASGGEPGGSPPLHTSFMDSSTSIPTPTSMSDGGIDARRLMGSEIRHLKDCVYGRKVPLGSTPNCSIGIT